MLVNNYFLHTIRLPSSIYYIELLDKYIFLKKINSLRTNQKHHKRAGFPIQKIFQCCLRNTSNSNAFLFERYQPTYSFFD